MPRFSKNEGWLLFLLFIVSFFLFCWKIASIPIIDGDSAFYAEIAKNILKSGDWLTMRYVDPNNIIDKPPLVFWLIAICFKLFGINEFGLAIWHSLFASLTVLGTCLIARELFNKKTALLSSFILLTSAQFFYQARVPLQDMPLTLFITGALFCFVLFEKYKNYLACYLIPVFLALAVLVKGPVGLALPGLIILSYLLISKRIFTYSKTDYLIHLPLSLGIFFLVAAPWFIAEYQILGQRIVDVFWTRNFGRFLFPVDTVGQQAHTTSPQAQYDFYSYFPQLLLLLIPWSGFLYPALYYQVKRQTENKFAKIFILCWALVPIIFFSLSLNYKIARYILPALPALAILIGKFWHDFLENPKELERPMKISNFLNLFLILPALLILVFMARFRFPNEQMAYHPIVFPFLAAISLGILISSILLFQKKAFKAFMGYTLFAFIAYLILIGSFGVHFKEANPMRYLSLRIKALAAPSDLVGQYIGSGTAVLNFYSDRQAALVNNEKDLMGLLGKKRKAYFITEHPEALEAFKKKHPNLVKIIEMKNAQVLFSN